MIEKDNAKLAIFNNDTTINAIPDGQDGDTDGDDTDSDTKPDGGNQ